MPSAFQVILRCMLSSVWLLVSGLIGYSSCSFLYGQRFDAGFAVLLMDSGHWREATRMLQARQKSAPWDIQATVLLARAVAGLGDLQRCAELLGSVPNSSPLKPEALLRQGQVFMQRADALEAEAAWRQCVQHPDASRDTLIATWRDLAQLYGTEDRREDLRAALLSRLSITDENNKIRVLQQLLDLNLVREEPKVRAQKLEEFVAANQRDVRAKVALGLAYLEANQLENGLKTLKACIEGFPSDVDAWRGWLRAVYQQGEIDSLAVQLGQAPEAMQQMGGFWKLQGIVAQDRGDWSHAVDCLARAVELSPFEPDLHSQLAVAFARLDQRELAEQHGQTAKHLRNAQSDLRTAYEDLIHRGARGDPPGSYQEIAVRISKACRSMGLDQDAGAWEAWAAALGKSL